MKVTDLRAGWDGDMPDGPIDVAACDEEVCVADVTPEKVHWLWPGRIPARKVILIDGDPGLGKSTLTLDVVARLSTASPMPDKHRPAEPVGSLLMSAEDGAGDTIRPRLEAAGADLNRVFLFDRVTDYDEHADMKFVRPVELPEDLPRVQRIVTEHDLGLIVIDPIVAFLGARTDAHRDQDVRRVLYPLAQMAQTTGCAIICIRHLNKTPGTNPLYRGGGSIGFIGAARLGLVVAPDPGDTDRRILAVSKSNLAVIPDSLAFRLCPDDFREVAAVRWEGPVATTAAELLGSGARTSPRAEAEEFLAELLARGPVATAEVEAAREREDISVATLRRAKKALGVTSIQPEGAPHPGWYWALSDQGSGDQVLTT
jgi:hypothetical protein